MFKLTPDEKAEVVANCDHLAKLKFSKVLPFAFTEHGAIQAANVLVSPQAVEMGIFVVRAFVRMRELAAVHSDLAKRLDELEQKTEGAGAVARHVQPQYARSVEAGFRRSARTHDAARSAQAAHRVRDGRGQGEEDFGGTRQGLMPRPSIAGSSSGRERQELAQHCVVNAASRDEKYRRDRPK